MSTKGKKRNRTCHVWTREAAAVVVSKYTTLKQFRDENGGLHATIKKNGWTDLLANLDRGDKVIWTREYAKSLVDQCDTLVDLRDKFPTGYKIMSKRGWQDLYDHLPRACEKWDRDKVSELVAKCTTLKEFTDNYHKAYAIVIAHKWHDLLQPLERVYPDKVEKWTREMVADCIAQCSNYHEFVEQYSLAYTAMLNHKWQDLAANLTRELPNRDTRNEWVVYKWWFPEENAVYIGLTIDFERRKKQELTIYTSSPIKQFLEDTGCSYETSLLHTGLNCDEANWLEKVEIQNHINAGFKVINRNGGGALGSYYTISNDDLFKYIHDNFDSVSELFEKDQSAYKKIVERRLLDDLKATFPDPEEERLALIKQHIANSTNLLDFKINYRSDIQFLHRRGLDHLYKVLPPGQRCKKCSEDDRLEMIKANIALCKTSTEFRRRFPSDITYLGFHKAMYLLDGLPSEKDLYTAQQIQAIKDAVAQCTTYREFDLKYHKLNFYVRYHKLEHMLAGLENLPERCQKAIAEHLSNCQEGD